MDRRSSKAHAFIPGSVGYIICLYKQRRRPAFVHDVEQRHRPCRGCVVQLRKDRAKGLPIHFIEGQLLFLCGSLGASVDLILEIAPLRVADMRGVAKVTQRAKSLDSLIILTCCSLKCRKMREIGFSISLFVDRESPNRQLRQRFGENRWILRGSFREVKLLRVCPRYEDEGAVRCFRQLLQFCVFGLGLLQEGDIRIDLFPTIRIHWSCRQSVPGKARPWPCSSPASR